MSTHSYCRLWTHLIWETLSREPMLEKRAAAKASGFLNDYSLENGIYMKINYFNADHTHALIDLPTSKCIEEIIKLFKGASSHWINQQRMLKGHFSWGRGGSIFCISLGCGSGRPVYSKPGRASSKKDVRRGVRVICKTLWSGVAR